MSPGSHVVQWARERAWSPLFCGCQPDPRHSILGLWFTLAFCVSDKFLHGQQMEGLHCLELLTVIHPYYAVVSLPSCSGWNSMDPWRMVMTISASQKWDLLADGWSMHLHLASPEQTAAKKREEPSYWCWCAATLIYANTWLHHKDMPCQHSLAKTESPGLRLEVNWTLTCYNYTISKSLFSFNLWDKCDIIHDLPCVLVQHGKLCEFSPLNWQ